MRYVLLFIFSVIIGMPSAAVAETQDFSISAFVVNDLVPPSTPTLLAVDPVAATQITVSWSAATDNYLLGGYVLLRDSLPIATTTLTTFSDTGLTPETLYSYEVYAFDVFYNLSTTSNALATTTPVAPPPPVVATSTQGQSSSATLVLKLLDFAVTTDINSVQFLWQTSLPSRYALRWGRNDTYDAGYIANEVYQSVHKTNVNELEPGTVYLYELVGYDGRGREVVLQRGEFKTTAREIVAIPNVQFFTAVVEGSSVSLHFAIPDTVPDAKVRIVRSHLGYPVDPYDGAVVYEGRGEMFLDNGALTQHDTLYYAAFVVASDGSVSSGAVLLVRKKSSGGEGGNATTTVATTTSSTTPVFEEPLPLPDEIFAATKINLIQGDVTYTFFDTAISLNSNEAFMLSIPYESLPKHLKSIIVTLFDPADRTRTYSFLLRINKDRTAYEATIAPLLVIGNSQLQVEIFEYEQRVMARYLAPVKFVVVNQTTPEVVFPDKLVAAVSPFFSYLLLLLILLLIPTMVITYRRLT